MIELNPGDKFNQLTIIEKLHKFKNRQRLYLCQCKCGKYLEFSKYDVVKERVKCCGCSGHTRKARPHKWKDYYELPGRIFHNIRHSAKRRNLEFNLTIEYLWDLYLKQDKKCALSGIDLKFCNKQDVKNRKLYQTSSLDRIDSSKGYIIGNVQWVHRTINKMKWDLNQEEFIDFCKKVVENNFDAP